MNIDWVEASKILLTAFASAILTGLLAFAAQKLIDRWFITNMEKFKAELQLASFEHQARFSKLHEKRAEVIAELYMRLARTQDTMRKLALSVQLLDTDVADTELERAIEQSQEFFLYFDQHRLYIPNELCEKLERLYHAFWKADGSFLGAKAHHTVGDDARSDEFAEQLISAVDEIPQIRKDIESGFSQMLGVAEVARRD